MGPLVVALNYLLGGINIDIDKITELQASGYKYAVWPYHIPQSNRTAVCCSSRTCKSLRIRWTEPEPEIFEQKALVCLKVICTGVSIAYLLANTFAT
jgi:hypothetical protein